VRTELFCVIADALRLSAVRLRAPIHRMGAAPEQTVRGSELGRGGCGARYMSCPIERDSA
jgi:hypothetical protein